MRGDVRRAFALKFKETVGSRRWISDAVADVARGGEADRSGDPVSAIARSLGYESESAFSTAFKR